MLFWSCDDSYHVCWIEFIFWIQVSKSYFKIYFWCAGEKVLTRDKRLSFHVSWSIALIDICFRSPYKTFLTPLRKVYDGSSSRFISTRISALPTYRKFIYLYSSWRPGKIMILWSWLIVIIYRILQIYILCKCLWISIIQLSKRDISNKQLIQLSQADFGND